MTTPPAVYAQFGQALAFAERTLTAILRAHLAERGTTPETWYALKLVAAGGPALSRDALLGDLAGSRDLSRDPDSDSPAALLARLEAEGLLTGGTHVALTPAGAARFESLREHVLAATARLLGQFDLADLETTVRTVRAITARAAAAAAPA